MTKYLITRTSKWCDEQPHEKAIAEDLDCWDIRTCSKEQLVLRDIVSKKESEEYTNYEDENGDIYCKKPVVYNLWTIEIDDLQKFCDELNERVVIFPKGYDPEYPYPKIEIYDTWRE